MTFRETVELLLAGPWDYLPLRECDWWKLAKLKAANGMFVVDPGDDPGETRWTVAGKPLKWVPSTAGMVFQLLVDGVVPFDLEKYSCERDKSNLIKWASRAMNEGNTEAADRILALCRRRYGR